MANSLCLTPACLQVASNLAWQLAPNWDKMDPCTDFDKMVCHGFKDNNGPNLDRLGLIGQRNNRIIAGMLDGTYSQAIDYQATPWKSTWTSNSVDEANFKMLKQSYDACMDTDTIAALNTQPLADLIASLNSIWPLTNDPKAKLAPADHDSLAKATYFLHEVGVSAFATMSVMTDFYDPVFNKDNVTSYSDPEAMKAYAKDIVEVLNTHLYPKNVSAEEATSIAEGIVNLEVDIVNALVPPVLDDANSKNVTLSELGAFAPPLGLDKVLRNLLPPNYPETKTIAVDPAAFFGNLTDIIASYPKHIIQSYLIHKTLASLGTSLITHGSPPTTPAERSEFCFQHLDASLRFVVGRFFVSATYPDAAHDFASKLATDLRAQFKERIDTLDWMSADAKARAKKKVDNMVQNIGYPTSDPDLRKPESIAAYYSTLNVTSNFFANVLSARKFAATHPFADVLKPSKRGDLGDKIPKPNASYQPQANSINIFAGISQLPLFSDALPGYASYASLGSIVGHEILHGFDDTGRLFNENAEHASWWDNATISAFEQRAQCFAKQYSAYTYPVPGGGVEHTNGNQTLGENLSDAGGLRIAYDAWKKTQTQTANGGKKDLDLPGLEKFTHDQLFFIFYANTWCESLTPEGHAKSWPTDTHAPHANRIIGGTANSRAFREAFQCKKREPECELF
ncbi:hypothetical protein B0T16DRAFT_502818 [Cercophora newfieldiana]|uniref:Endothelin-converting enzyme 1 n=1 Tax=Cercophora newfieldiana TaxID=92897 RepID=A0AA40D136_9PEZI|nr:hypothetical protein B0T16DRAFT_502818 [Cercophora newfieldiana]